MSELKSTYTTNGEVTTDSTGVANAKIEEADYGKYYFVEETKTESSFATAPFMLEVPSYISGKGYATTMNVYPKNKVTTPTPGKDVSVLGNNDSSANIGDQVKWYLKGTIPADIDTYKTYEFSDTLDKALTYDKSFTPVVKVGKSTTLVAGTDYTVTEPTSDSNVFKVALTSSGMKKAYEVYQTAGKSASASEIADISENTDSNPFIEVEFATTINENAVMGKQIDNKVTLNFHNDGNVSGNPESDTTEVHTGGIRFIKKDAVNGNVLSGAVFELYEADGTTPVKWTQAMIDANGSTGFQDQAVGNAVKLVSKEDGTFEIKGLKYGSDGEKNASAKTKYVLKETKAPEGYNLPDKATTDVTVSATSYYTDPTATSLTAASPVEILNNKTPNLPLTGGIGAMIFALAGLAVAGFAFYEIKKRRQA
ncbi:hypothetical protein lacNasYZ03_02140 [Lactobacillus nasalidis]|uniref:Isopeptide-forming domain-containing fimbrial protein n=1 Tax=Lactobacillus nasalidis TaxID=2797258 RepID=A0ABQ3W6J9_9LACO|nr:SpaH/EbpB family LPXTG-anchored major pilin [Lactobacillus nasalidis]GHV97408.1 hypothetical protein lacNasYZ01_05900 [Lactobacillus nasalidis]GHV99752.1 hypothetical protein lacNasYZ02_11820 [Lactobacillus nasalidis]GHW00527.1 hypothetical protein lacNasYZ03_02140 [Lactobacillus nasalidis]